MKFSQTIKLGLMAGAAMGVLVSCSDTSVSSPGAVVSPPAAPPATPPATPPAATINLVPTSGCYTGTSQINLASSGSLASMNVCALSDTITSDVIIPAGATVAVSGATFIGNDSAAVTLTLGAGAVIFGSTGNDYLAITRGAQINAVGTANSPIIMTSRNDINTDGSAGLVTDSTIRGQWGGLVINGRAPINACNNSTAITNGTGGGADCVKDGEGASGLFGGDRADDNSGTLNYVQVRYAGFQINDTDELNGIAFQGVGSGTNVDYIQVHNNADDGIEFFGGTVNVKHVVLTGNADDSMDYTDGWQGKAQYVVVRQASDDGDNAFEFDNFETDDNRLPRSNPSIANFTLLGNGTGGFVVREGSAGQFANGILVNGTFDIDDSPTFDRLDGNGNFAGDEPLSFQSILIDSTTPFATDSGNEKSDGTPVDLATAFTNDNVIATNSSLVDTYFPGPIENSFTSFSFTDTFLDTTDYIGAFAPTMTETNNWARGWTIGLFDTAPASCPAGIAATGETINGTIVCGLSGEIITDTTLTNGVLYQLTGQVSVGRDVGGDGTLANGQAATLTIEAGVTIFGNTGNDFLSVQRGSKIRSNGTASAPVVMTSRQDVEGTTNPMTDRGQWGGLVINGRAPINACSDASAIVNGVGGGADCEKGGEGSSGNFGGALSGDDSGDLFYTRVQYAGFKINDTDELNGIAFQGVGSGTNVDYIQVHNNADDGVEFFGGTVNVKHVVLTGNADDSMDYTDGWQGKAQFILIDQADDDSDNGFEFDNFETDDDRQPRSNPTILNFTIIGNADNDANANPSRGFRIREGSAGFFANGIIAGGFANGGLDIDDASTFDLVSTASAPAANRLSFHSILIDDTTPFDLDGVSDAQSDSTQIDISTFWAGNNVSGSAGASSLTTSYFPGANEAAVPVFNITGDSFFTSTDRIGAFSSTETAANNWTTGWTLSGSLASN